MDELLMRVYLRDLLDLELAKRKLSVSYQQNRNEYEEKLAQWSQSQEEAAQTGRSPVAAYVLIAIAAGLAGMALTFLGGYDMTSGMFHIGRTYPNNHAIITGVSWWNLFLVITGVVLMVVAAVFTFAGRYRVYQNLQQQRRREQDHEHARRQIEETWEIKRSALKEKNDEVSRLLKQGYRYALLPQSYQELSCVYYLYLRQNATGMNLNSLIRQISQTREIPRYRERIRSEIIKRESQLLAQRAREAGDAQTVMQNLNMLTTISRTDPRRSALASAIADLYAQTSNLFSKPLVS